VEYRKEDNNGNDKEGLQPTRHTITMYGHLEIGERVIMTREEGGQRYFVLDRQGKMMENGTRCDTNPFCFE
jgi:hypothetical protein